jgi:hypothetical protein
MPRRPSSIHAPSARLILFNIGRYNKATKGRMATGGSVVGHPNLPHGNARDLGELIRICDQTGAARMPGRHPSGSTMPASIVLAWTRADSVAVVGDANEPSAITIVAASSAQKTTRNRTTSRLMADKGWPDSIKRSSKPPLPGKVILGGNLYW